MKKSTRRLFDVITWSILLSLIIICIIYVVKDINLKKMERYVDYDQLENATNILKVDPTKLRVDNLEVDKKVTLNGNIINFDTNDNNPPTIICNKELVIDTPEGLSIPKGNLKVKNNIFAQSLFIQNPTNNKQSMQFTDKGLQIANDSLIEMGYGEEKQGDAGKIAYKKWSNGLDIVGAGNKERHVKFWDTVDVKASLCMGNTCVKEDDLKNVHVIKQLQDTVNQLKKQADELNEHLYDSLKEGLFCQIYAGYFNDDVRWFDKNAPIQINTAKDFTNITSITNNVKKANNGENYSVMLNGFVKCTASGNWSFSLSSDDASYMWIGEHATNGYIVQNAFINNSGQHGLKTEKKQIELSKGKLYPIRIMYGNKDGPGDLQFSMTLPNGKGMNTAGNILVSN